MYFSGYIHLAAGLSCGMTGLAAGHAIGMIGDAVRVASTSIEISADAGRQSVRMFLFQSRVFVGMVLMLSKPHRYACSTLC